MLGIRAQVVPHGDLLKAKCPQDSEVFDLPPGLVIDGIRQQPEVISSAGVCIQKRVLGELRKLHIETRLHDLVKTVIRVYLFFVE